MKKIYLTLSAILLALMGFIFILAPNAYLAGLGANLNDPNLLNVLRSFGGFYLGFAVFLGVTLKKQNLMDAAVFGVVLVMAGFLMGRGMSLMADGLPNPRLWISLGIELCLALWGLLILLRPTHSK